MQSRTFTLVIRVEYMKKVILYIAQSLDGYIATKDGGVAWLDNYFSDEFKTEKFIEEIDTVVQGNTTYEQFKSKYPGKDCYVFSKKADTRSEEGVTFVRGRIVDFIDGLDENTHKNIWLVGGATLITNFLNENQINEMRIFVMPILLGDGIALFQNIKIVPKLTLQGTKNYSNGVVELRYIVAK